MADYAVVASGHAGRVEISWWSVGLRRLGAANPTYGVGGRAWGGGYVCNTPGLNGGITALWSAMSMPRLSHWRVVAGSITSSTQRRAAA